MTKSFGFEQKEKARNSSIFLPFVKNNIDSLNTMSATVSTSADPSVEPAVESKGEPAVFSVAASSTVPAVIPVAASASEPVDIPVPVSAVAPAVVPAAVPAAVSALVPAAVPAAISAVFPAVVPAAATSTVPVAVTTDNSATLPTDEAVTVLADDTDFCSSEVTKSHLPVEYIELVDLYVSTISRETSDTEKSGSLSVASIESIVDNNSKTATSSDAVSKNPRYAAHKRKIPSDEKIQERSVPAIQSTSASSARTLTPDPRSKSQPSSSGIPSFCATKKKKAKTSAKIKLDISRYPAGWNPRISNSSASSSSAIIPTAPPAQRNQHNLSAAIACSSFTPYEYSKKVKALELLTGKRDLSVNPFCKVVVTGIIPQPIRMVKKALIELTIRVEMVGKISFVGNTTEFLVLKAYKDKFCFKIGSNPFITIIYS
ncbi:hypothetical protein AYI69_g10031 [Smittium culicis]|uniref:Uncharacterized protein n=1 Tax=Smittium culicis TaxID=133412 RepID=A0A1R1X8N7_9FUNG|nr:hypothetical protein AYI69_g10031 [Smittium culicis]